MAKTFGKLSDPVDIFTVKSILDEMNRIGTTGSGHVNLARQAAWNLYIDEDSPVVEIAIGYVTYEMYCFTMAEKPLSLATWAVREQKKLKKG